MAKYNNFEIVLCIKQAISKDQSKQRRFIGQNKCEGMCEKSE